MQESRSRIYNNHGILQITLESPGCFYRKNGYCKMCHYGSGRKITAEEAAEITGCALKTYPHPAGILVGSFGSLLDEREIDRATLSAVLEVVNKSPIKSVYIETHANTVDFESLSFLNEKLPKKTITIEMGLESANPIILKKIVNKCLDLDALKHTMELIHSFGMRVALNIIYGLWYEKNQMQKDFIETCNWANENGADEIVMFLLNIKPNTYIKSLYDDGNLSLPQHPEFISTLIKLNDDILSKTYFSWFGERQQHGEDMQFIPPDYAGLDPEKTMRFYYRFMVTQDVSIRRMLATELLESFPT